MEKPHVTDEQWGCIVPAILMIGAIIFVVVTQCDGPAKAAEVQPSPSPTPDVVGHAISINALGIVGAAIFVAVMAWLAYRNMIKHENS